MNAFANKAPTGARDQRVSRGRGGAAVAISVVALLGAPSCRGGDDPADQASARVSASVDTDATVAVTLTLPPALELTPTSCPLGTALVAADETTGAVLWNHCAGSLGGIQVLAADERTVLAAEYGADVQGVTVLGLDAATGTQRWSRTVAAFNESYERDAFYADGNQLGSGVVVFSTLDRDESGRSESFTVGIDAVSGHERWRVPTEDTFVTAHGEDVAIAATPGAMFETPSDAEQPPLHVVAFDRATGKVRWREDQAIRDLFAPWGPRIGDNVMVFTQTEPAPEETPLAERRWETVAVDASSGKKLWGREQGPFLSLVAGDTSIGMIPKGPETYELEGLGTRTGDKQWATTLTTQWPWLLSDPTSPVVAVGTTNAEGAVLGVTVFDRSSGSPRWRVDEPVEPAGVAGELVLVSRPGELAALDAASGALRWQMPFAHPFGTEVEASNGRLYLSSSSGMFDQTSPEDIQAELAISGGTDLASFTLPNGDTVRFVETGAAGGPQYLCAHPNQSTSAMNCITERDEPPLGGVTSLMPTQGGVVQFPSGLRSLYVVPLPAGHPRPVSVRAPNGTIWPAAEATDHDLLLILDPEPGGGSGLSTRSSLEVVTADGAVVATIASQGTGPAPGVVPPASPPSQWWVLLAACYQAQGANYQATASTAPPTASSPPTSVLPFDVATAAWQACQGILLVQSGAPPGTFDPAFFDCMAARGWLPPLFHQALEPMRSDSITCGVTPS